MYLMDSSWCVFKLSKPKTLQTWLNASLNASSSVSAIFSPREYVATAQESCELVLDFLELNGDWWIILTSQKSFCSSNSQTLLFGGEKRPPEIRLRSQARLFHISLISLLKHLPHCLHSLGFSPVWTCSSLIRLCSSLRQLLICIHHIPLLTQRHFLSLTDLDIINRLWLHLTLKHKGKRSNFHQQRPTNSLVIGDLLTHKLTRFSGLNLLMEVNELISIYCTQRSRVIRSSCYRFV